MNWDKVWSWSFSIGVIAVFGVLLHAAGTVTLVEETIGAVKQIKWTFTTDSSGDADQITTKVYDGKVIGLITDPTDPLSDNWDLVINDANGYDVLVGSGANRDTTVTEFVQDPALLGSVSTSTLNMVVSNAGAVSGGIVLVLIR